MTETFEVGQKVHHNIRGDAEVAYGPFDSPWGGTRYVIRLDSGKETTVSPENLSAIPEPPTFAIGDKVVTATGIRGVIDAGPFKNRHASGGVFWVVADEAGTHVMPFEEGLTKVVEPEPIKAGDVVRILHDDADGADVKAGDLLAVKIVGAFGKVRVHAAPGARMSSWYIGGSNYAKVPADEVAVHDGVVYDLSAKYKDTDGDAWKFARIGDEVRGNYTSRRVEEWDETLAAVVRSYGPLTRV